MGLFQLWTYRTSLRRSWVSLLILSYEHLRYRGLSVSSPCGGISQECDQVWKDSEET